MKYISLILRELLFTYRFVKPAYLVFTLCALCVLSGKTPAQEWKAVHDGVEYAQVDHKIGGDPVKINLLRLDLKKVRLDVHHALDKAIGLETTSSIAQRKSAVAAINAGFFRLDKSEFAGDSAGVLAIDGHLVSESANDRVVMILENGPRTTRVDFLHVKAFARAGFGVDSSFTFDGINRERKVGEIILFTSQMGETTRTPADGVEIILTKCERLNRCEHAEIREQSGNSSIPKEGYVISIGAGALDKSNNVIWFAKETNKRPLEIDNLIGIFETIRSSQEKISRMLNTEDITNGVPQLIKNSKIDITWEQEKASRAFVLNRHPRTAVAKLKDGKFLMMTVDGRQPGVSVGMTLQELAEYLFSLGAVDAMNLDGGGSTTMFLDGKVVNKPSDPTGERKIGDAVVVTLRKKPAAKK